MVISNPILFFKLPFYSPKLHFFKKKKNNNKKPKNQHLGSVSRGSKAVI